ncbi:hypothetical protein F503_08813 [Ophiostoma piceae UAMH 11346]|uniref:Uncharacterized protein n=1 Tax=Ophiostoma piceae (strain UAMH 11346) TaxID=1262450 RepID=S3BU24_OPHP1|nr:hypothetical protein F503_08813 [Ophiostoma piceae UAMH 11346]
MLAHRGLSERIRFHEKHIRAAMASSSHPGEMFAAQMHGKLESRARCEATAFASDYDSLADRISKGTMPDDEFVELYSLASFLYDFDKIGRNVDLIYTDSDLAVIARKLDTLVERYGPISIRDLALLLHLDESENDLFRIPPLGSTWQQYTSFLIKFFWVFFSGLAKPLVDWIGLSNRKTKSLAAEFPSLLCPPPLQEAIGAESDFKCHLEAIGSDADHTDCLRDVYGEQDHSICFEDPDKPSTKDDHPVLDNFARSNFVAFYRSLDPAVLEKQAIPPESSEHACYLHHLYAQRIRKYRNRGARTTTFVTVPKAYYEVPFACERAKRDIGSLSCAERVDSSSGPGSVASCNCVGSRSGAGSPSFCDCVGSSSGSGSPAPPLDYAGSCSSAGGMSSPACVDTCTIGDVWFDWMRLPFLLLRQNIVVILFSIVNILLAQGVTRSWPGAN